MQGIGRASTAKMWLVGTAIELYTRFVSLLFAPQYAIIQNNDN